MWQNLKLVELASVLAGPLVGSFFSELGVQVIKIENKRTGGDVTRQWKLPSENPSKSISAYYASANYKKEIRMLDFTKREDYDEVIELIMEADIVIQNFKAGDAVKLKLDAEFLHELNPSLIIGKITGFGDEDTRPAFDVVLQAETGYLSMCGTESGELVKMPVALIDILAAHHLKEAILIALMERSINKKGKIVSVSLYDAALASLANQASSYLMEGKIAQAMGSKHPNIAPYGDQYLCKDGKKIVLAVGTERHFKALCEILNLSLYQEDNFCNNTERLKNRTEMNDKIQEAMNIYTSNKLMEMMTKNGIPAGKIKNLEEVLTDEKAKSMIQNYEIEGFKSANIKTYLN